MVLNLVINGLPSIQNVEVSIRRLAGGSFKPCYKWITFNTTSNISRGMRISEVLNLVINGLPSILMILNIYGKIIVVLNLVINGLPSIQQQSGKNLKVLQLLGFKPCYKWITFNTIYKIS